ncbi:MAG: hypothetical protein JO112_11430 [Planctomycetes bacterium]|nr:hypothetical protein [Planctomycetota bacterium]
MDLFWEQHTREITILVISALVLLTVLILVPQLIRAHHRIMEMHHQEHLRMLENGQPVPPPDNRSQAAGRTAALVPMVVICAAGTVTCFLGAYQPENLFAVSLAVWAVAGVVSLAAITGGVALLGRLAQLQSDRPEDEDQKEEEEFTPHSLEK